MRSLCILIVDDNVDAADALGSICEAAGHEVDFAYDAAAALEAARRLKPDVIFIEPAFGEVARQLRAEPGLADTLLIEGLAKPVSRELVLQLLQKRAQRL